MAASAEAGLQVAGQVREIRRARNLSQRQLAGRMQVPRTYISKIENGKAMPTLSSLARPAPPPEIHIFNPLPDAPSPRHRATPPLPGYPFLAHRPPNLPHLASCQR